MPLEPEGDRSAEGARQGRVRCGGSSFVELCWCTVAETFARVVVELVRDPVTVALCDAGHAGSLRQVGKTQARAVTELLT
jgi:hypothetical protein